MATAVVDAGDLSSEREIDRVAAGLARIDPAIPAGVAGECDDCGEMMPRLVDGRCGFCRDGRRPPADRYAAAEARLRTAPPPAAITPPPSSSPPQEKETTMPNPPPSTDFQAITMPARGDLLKAIRDRAAAQDVSLSKAAMALIERAIAEPSPETNIINGPPPVESIATVDLLAELGRRVSGAVTPDTFAAIEARAIAAEARLAQAAALLSGDPA